MPLGASYINSWRLVFFLLEYIFIVCAVRAQFRYQWTFHCQNENDKNKILAVTFHFVFFFSHSRWKQMKTYPRWKQKLRNRKRTFTETKQTKWNGGETLILLYVVSRGIRYPCQSLLRLCWAYFFIRFASHGELIEWQQCIEWTSSTELPCLNDYV